MKQSYQSPQTAAIGGPLAALLGRPQDASSGALGEAICACV